MLKLQNIKKQFSAGKTVFAGVNQSFNQGEFIGLIGPNGSGKTTFLRLISVNSFPTEGEVNYNGTNIHKKPAHYLKDVGLVHDEENLPLHLSAVELMEWVLRKRNLWNEKSQNKIEEIFDKLELGEDRYNQIGTYSTGMKKKTQIAAAFIIDPKVLILDEPLRGLDEATRGVIYEMLKSAKARDTLILMASHTINRNSEMLDKVIDFPLTAE